MDWRKAPILMLVFPHPVRGAGLFADYAGQTVPIVDAATGEIRAAQIFLATLGASNYTYACATATQTAADWVGSLIGALEFIGAVPRLIVPDQPRALIAQPDRYEPGVGRLVEEFCNHYSVAVLPARPAHPRDKPKVECAVLVVERWILARLRNRRFFSLPVLLGTVGGIGLLIGPAGLLWLNLRRHPDHGDRAQQPMDRAFIALLFFTSLTGLALLAWRDTGYMGLLLAVHLGVVMALFLTMPYGKFAHCVYRSAALLKSAIERRMPNTLNLGAD